MNKDGNFDFTKPTESIDVEPVQKHNYKKPVKDVLLGRKKIGLHNAIMGFVLLVLLTLSLVYLLNQKEKVNIVERQLSSRDKLSSKINSPIIYTGANYSIVFEKDPEFLLTKKEELVNSTLMPNIKAGKDTWYVKKGDSDIVVVKIEVMENSPSLEFEKIVNDYKDKLGLNDSDIKIDKTNQGFLISKIGGRYEIIQSKTSTYFIDLETSEEKIQNEILKNIQFN